MGGLKEDGVVAVDSGKTIQFNNPLYDIIYIMSNEMGKIIRNNRVPAGFIYVNLRCNVGQYPVK